MPQKQQFQMCGAPTVRRSLMVALTALTACAVPDLVGPPSVAQLPSRLAAIATKAPAPVAAKIVLMVPTALGVGKFARPTAVVVDAAGRLISPMPAVTWTSSDRNVVYVTSAGWLFGYGFRQGMAGRRSASAVITAKSGNVTASATVAVSFAMPAGFFDGFCTAEVGGRFQALTGLRTPSTRSAGAAWMTDAKLNGFITTTDPAKAEANSVVVYDGHVAILASNGKGGFTIFEMNTGSPLQSPDADPMFAAWSNGEQVHANYNVETTTAFDPKRPSRGTNLTFLGLILPRKVK